MGLMVGALLMVGRCSLLLLLNLEFMPINYILMRLLHDVFEICTLLHNVLFDYFFCEVTDVRFVLKAKLPFCWARWRKVVLFSGTLETVVIYVAQVVDYVIYFSLSILAAVHGSRASSFAHWSVRLLYMELRKLIVNTLVHSLFSCFCFLLLLHHLHLLLKNVLKLIFKISIMTPRVFLMPLKHSINIPFKLQDLPRLIHGHLCQLLHAVIILLT